MTSWRCVARLRPLRLAPLPFAGWNGGAVPRQARVRMNGPAHVEAGRERVSDVPSVAGMASMPRPLGCPREGTIAAWKLPASARRQHPPLFLSGTGPGRIGRCGAAWELKKTNACGLPGPARCRN